VDTRRVETRCLARMMVQLINTKEIVNLTDNYERSYLGDFGDMFSKGTVSVQDVTNSVGLNERWR